jgi:GNAT superfamily N-acetyltransferase
LVAILELNKKEYWFDIEKWGKESMITRWKKGSWWVDPKTIQWHWDVLNQCHGGIIIAIIQGKIIAELDYVLSKDHIGSKLIKRYHIIWLLVDKDHRRMGIAKKLIQKLQELSQNIPIWVEAEDKRSDSLYRSIGKPIQYISNWSTNLVNSELLNNFDGDVTYSPDLKLIFERYKQEWRLIIGKYYAPSYDIVQISNSDQVDTLIWGNAQPAKIVEYKLNKTKAIGIVTQYPRVLVKNTYDRAEISQIIAHLAFDALAVGFDSIYLQVYSSDDLNEILPTIGFRQMGELDNIYQLETAY